MKTELVGKCLILIGLVWAVGGVFRISDNITTVVGYTGIRTFWKLLTESGFVTGYFQWFLSGVLPGLLLVGVGVFIRSNAKSATQ